MIGMRCEVFERIMDPERVLTNKYALDLAATDESGLGKVRPCCVLQPVSEEEVISIVRTCSEQGIPIVPRGAGTGLEGAAIPIDDSVVVDMTLMNRVLNVSMEDRFCLIEPGIIYNDLNKKLADYGLFFPPSPGGSSDSATVGGMVSTNASGIYAFRYGGTGDWVKTLRVITGSGDVVDLGTMAPKSSDGYDLLKLFVGAEGTLGVIVQIGLRLAPLPQVRVKKAFRFNTLHDALQAGIEISWGVPKVAAVELLDQATIGAISLFLNEDIDPGHYLFLEFHDDMVVPDEVFDITGEVIQEFHGVELKVDDPWRLRHYGTRAVTHQAKAVVRTDAGVPLTKMLEYVDWATSYTDQLPVYAFGHLGIGIIHLLIPYDPDDPSQMEMATAFKKDAAIKAVELGGTVSGEHGIGIGNKEALKVQLGNKSEIYMQIKRLFDPYGIMNPTKLL